VADISQAHDVALMHAPGCGLESSGADSSGLTEAGERFLDGVDVRLSEQQVVGLALCWALHLVSSR
jgi:hypothetical protein